MSIEITHRGLFQPVRMDDLRAGIQARINQGKTDIQVALELEHLAFLAEWLHVPLAFPDVRTIKEASAALRAGSNQDADWWFRQWWGWSEPVKPKI